MTNIPLSRIGGFKGHSGVALAPALVLCALGREPAVDSVACRFLWRASHVLRSASYVLWVGRQECLVLRLCFCRFLFCFVLSREGLVQLSLVEGEFLWPNLT